MTNVFLNQGSPNYGGVTFSDGTSLLSQIQTTLLSVGWATIAYTAGSDLFMQGTTITGGFNCFVDFAISGTSPNFTLTIRGWLESGKVNGSPASTHTLTFTYGNTNYLWLSADQESGGICIYNSTGACQGIHFGFLQRVDVTDPWAWMVGFIRVYGEQYAYVAKSKFNGAVWKQLSTDYYQFSIPYAAATAAQMPVTTWDLLGRICSSVAANATGNSAYAILGADLGRVNYDASYVIDPYLYVEGRGVALTGYTPNSIYQPNNFQMYFRGPVKFCSCGVASAPAANQIIDSASGFRILSTGGNYWQGLRVA